MSEMLQLVRTVFTADSQAFQKTLASVQAAASTAQRDVVALEREIDKLMATDHVLDIQVKSGSINTLASKFQDRDLGKLLGHRGEERMADQWMLDELDRLKALARGAAPAVDDLGDALDRAGGSAGKSKGDIGGFRDGVKDVLGPADDLKGGLSILRENIFVIGGAAAGAIAGIDALSDAFSDSDEIAAEYGKQMKNIAADLDRMAKSSREVREFLSGNQRPESVSRLEEIQGTKNSPGEWERANDQLRAVQDRKDELQALARRMDIPMDPSGNVFVPDGGFDNDQSRAWKKIQDTTVTDDAGNHVGNLSETLAHELELIQAMRDMEVDRANLAAQALEDHLKAMWGSAETQKNLEMGALAAKTLGTNLTQGIDAFLGGALSAAELLGGKVAANFGYENPIEKWVKDLLGPKKEEPKPKKYGVNIDARNAKIQVTTKLETDDPARFADATVKSAFLGATAKPLAAVTSIGGVSSGSR